MEPLIIFKHDCQASKISRPATVHLENYTKEHAQRQDFYFIFQTITWYSRYTLHNLPFPLPNLILQHNDSIYIADTLSVLTLFPFVFVHRLYLWKFYRLLCDPQKNKKIHDSGNTISNLLHIRHIIGQINYRNIWNFHGIPKCQSLLNSYWRLL